MSPILCDLTGWHNTVALWDWCYPDYWMSDGYIVDGTEQQWTLVSGSSIFDTTD